MTYYGMRYIVPALANSPKVILAVNVGGVVIPTLLSIYPLSKNGLWGRGMIATVTIAAICHALAQPIAASASACLSSSRRWPRPSSPQSSPGATRRRSPMPGQPWRADRRRPAQSRQASGPRGASPFDRRCRHFRRNLRHWHDGGAAGRVHRRWAARRKGRGASPTATRAR